MPVYSFDFVLRIERPVAGVEVEADNLQDALQVLYARVDDNEIPWSDGKRVLGFDCVERDGVTIVESTPNWAVGGDTFALERSVVNEYVDGWDEAYEGQLISDAIDQDSDDSEPE